MATQDDTKSTTKKNANPKAKPTAPQAKAGKQTHRAGKPSNPFLVENPPEKMRGSRK
jgi:hypothetical protein